VTAGIAVGTVADCCARNAARRANWSLAAADGVEVLVPWTVVVDGWVVVLAYLIAVIRIDAVVLVIAMVLFVVVDVVIENHTGIPWILL
jgi:hypothetical protein